MSKDITMTTSRASLCALGEYLKRHCFFAPLQEQVQISQKTVRHRPIDKVLDGLLGILCGAKTISQSNVTIRVDPAVQRAFGRTGCAEQSTIARTLQASTAETVDQLSWVSWYYLKRYGQTPAPSIRGAPVVDRCRCHAPAHWRAGRGQRAHLDGAQPQQDWAESVAMDGE